ncbi:hypothetical protein PZA11_002772 [Diplocarpon coronariae]|uniref:Gti1/Pac2 family protein n=1 Tax=Diplocarpon coronariae TaxID=2795749 RepID=A0A218YZK2_9HELO|nr:gti1/Pac2 family protein [Diplocarpon mali]OWP00475.1 hypothetical protein B2J93_786 [Marssonina coronariae]
MTSASPLSPTFYGHIASTQDALLLFEACLSGALNHVARRPHDRERVSLIKSGNVFIYEEHSSGIKRWTDGVPWSPSRILGNFLVYRELERPFPPGEKKRAMKRSKRSPGINKPDPFGGSGTGAVGNGYMPAAAAAAAASAAASSFDAQSPNPLSKETERSLIGSLVDSYGFKEEGLVKKTVSVTVGGVSHHLVSYYTVADVMNNKFTTPSKDPRFQHITPRPDLITKQNFRTPIDEVDSMDRIDDRSVYASYPYARSGYEMTNQTMAHRPMSLPTPPITYASNPTVYNNTYGQYDGIAPAHAPNGYGGQFTAPSPGLYPPTKPESFEVGGYRPQRYNSVIGIGSEARAQVPPVTTTFARRPSNYEQGGSADSGLSGISATSSDSKLTSDSGYASQGFYSGMRDSATTPHSYTGHRSLPTPTHQTTFDRIPPQTYTPVESPSLKQEMWSMGNSSSGHAHYMAPQWASTGTS